MKVIYKKGITITIITLLAILGTLIVVPTAEETAEATEYPLNVQAVEYLDVTLDGTGTLAVTPSAEGTFGEQTVGVTISGNAGNGYTASMYSTATKLVRTASINNETPEIATLADDNSGNGYTSENFPVNKWGFRRVSGEFTDGGYRPMISNNFIPLGYTSAGTNSHRTTVSFGTKLDNETPAGTYTITLNFVAVANRATPQYMQNISASTLATLMPNVGDTTILIDNRDNNSYKIAKLADGKYWMISNLDLAGGTALYSGSSNVPAGYEYTPYYTLPASSTTGFDNDGAAYAYVYNSPNKTDSCGSGCYSYYSYNAATAMSGTSISTDNTDAPYSICPAGWRLPTSRTTVELAQGTPGSDFYKMAIHYGLKDSVVNEDPDNDGMNFCTLGGDCGTNTVPRFLRAGDYSGSTFYNGGANGAYWSSTASSSTDAHYLGFYSGSVYSAGSNPRRLGFSVRCLFAG